jgi:hypothetical protein
MILLVGLMALHGVRWFHGGYVIMRYLDGTEDIMGGVAVTLPLLCHGV